MSAAPLFYSVLKGPNDRAGKETAFFEDKSRIFQDLEKSFNEIPYAAPSSIFRCLLLREREAKTKNCCSGVLTGGIVKKSLLTATGPTSSYDGTVPTATIRSNSAAIIPEKKVGEQSEISTSTSIFLSQRAQRGLQVKDLALQRLVKKRQKNLVGGVSSENGLKTHVSGDQEKISGSSSDVNGSVAAVVAPLHWSKRSFSAMTPTSWQVFREEVGISVEVVRPRVVSSSISSSLSSSPTSLSTLVSVPPPLRCWGEAGLPYILGKVVAKMFAFPTAIQSQCVPILLQEISSSDSSLTERKVEKMDLLAVSETGGGKTGAYLIPAITDILVHRPKLLHNHELVGLGPFVLIAVPTRELAEQVYGETRKIIKGEIFIAEKSISIRGLEMEQQNYLRESSKEGEETAEEYRKKHNLLEEIRVVKVVGGERMEHQHEQLSYGAHIVVGTIGQLYALLEARLLSLGNTKMIIVDEADRMMEDSSKGYLDAVLQQAPPREVRQTALFTATLTTKCEKVVREYFSPQRGHIVVRTPYRCPTVRQEFEVFPSVITTTAETTGWEEHQNNRHRRTTTDDPERGSSTEKAEGAGGLDRSDPLLSSMSGGRVGDFSLGMTATTLACTGLHPMKFARLITWLLYAPPPIIVFANEKKTCDALQDALLAEEARLRRDFPDVASIQAVMGECPAGLLFLTSFHSPLFPGTGVQSRDTAATCSFSSTISLANLSSVAVVHSDNSQEERKRLVQQFQRGERRVLITTDLLARGLDVPGVSVVLNYDVPCPRALRTGKRKYGLSTRVTQGGKRQRDEDVLPKEGLTERDVGEEEEAIALYIHRIGRTGRAGALGLAVSFLCLTDKVWEEFLQHREYRLWAGDTGDRGVLDKTIDRSLKNNVGGEIGWKKILGQESLDASDSSSSSSDDESDEGSLEDAQQRKRNRREGREKSMNHILSSPKKIFSDDLSFLPLLWEFLVSVVESNQHGVTITRDPSRLLLENRFDRIFLPPVLSSLMHREAEGQHFDALIL